MTCDVLPRTAALSKQRDSVLDLLRIGALVIVVLWHWVFTTIHLDGGPRVGNPVGVTPGLWLLTWFLQPMPVFFAVGGFLHAASFGGRPTEFWRRRVRRLLVPALPLLAIAAVVLALASSAGRPDIVRGVVLVVSPMWFLAVYLVLVLLAPIAVEAHRRRPVASLVVLGLAVLVLDLLRFHAGWSSMLQTVMAFVLVWGFVHQLGFHLGALRSAATRTRLSVLGAGLTSLIVCVTVGPYSTAMVGVPGEKISNFSPPTVAVACLAVFQLALLACLETTLARLAQRWRAGMDRIEPWIMPVFVWHLTGYTAFYLLLLAVGIEVPGTPTAAWWLSRPLWLIGPGALTAGLLVGVTQMRTHQRDRTTRITVGGVPAGASS